MNPALVTVLDALRWIGISPEAMIAAFVGGLIGAFAPAIVDEIRVIIKRFKESPSKFDDVAVPILEAIAGKLDGGVKDQATMDDLSNLMAKSIWESTKDPKKAKDVAREFSRELVKRALRDLEEKGKF